MPIQYDTAEALAQGEQESERWSQQVQQYLQPYHERLDAYVDRRTADNVMAGVQALLSGRGEVTLTQLGSHLCGPAHADAGTQRLHRALHHRGWSSQVFAQVMWQQADDYLAEVEQQGDDPLCIWDSSVLEKPESERLQGLGVVRSAKARRLARRRAGIFNRLGVPIRVPGWEWESLLLAGQKGRPQLVTTRWWGRQKGVRGQQREQWHALLSQVASRWGRRVRHVFDRGYDSGNWLWWLHWWGLRFVLRWKKGNKLLDGNGVERKAWEIARGKRSWQGDRLLWDWQDRCYRRTRLLVLPVRHPEYDGPLFLIVVRQGKGREPWYLLTNEVIETAEQAWQIVLSYLKRWKIEESYRFEKTELRIESVRLHDAEARSKLLWMLTLAHGFLLCMLSPPMFAARCQLLWHWDQRADWRLWQVQAPLVRLRTALGRLWQAHPPQPPWHRPYRPQPHITWPFASWRWWITVWHRAPDFCSTTLL